MKKITTLALAFLAVFSLSMGLCACSSDDDNNKEDEFTSAANIDYSSSNAEQWGNYMVTVASLLRTDASNLYKYWNETSNDTYSDSYANIFKNHNGTEGYSSALNCVQQIIEGCADIASEVGASKIGEPYNLYVAGQKTEALYAVESWYSWHSRDDYTNNIYSIRNSYYGSRNGSVNANSLSALLAEKNPTLNARAIAYINAAANAIQAIPQPFRNNINSSEAKAAMEACGELEDFLKNDLEAYFTSNASTFTDAVLDPIVEQYVDGVVLPTYKELAEKNATLYTKVVAFKKSPSTANFAACAEAWLSAREPWESSEAFLFGPVDAKGLDPNMDSWPLDQVGIVNILKSQDFKNLEWSEDEGEDEIEAAQSLRGFHTLEFLVFKDGEARSVK